MQHGLAGPEKAKVGATGVEVVRLGFGSASLGNLYREIGDANATAAVETAFDAGLVYFDTAPRYGFGLSETRLGRTLGGRDRATFQLSTKVGRSLVPDDQADVTVLRHGFMSPIAMREVFDYGYDATYDSLENSGARLNVDHFDIVYIHDLGRLVHGARHEAVLAEAIDGAYRALDDLKAAGIVGAIGLGVNEWEVCVEAMRHARFDVFLLAGRYTLLDQSARAEFLPRCAAHGASVIAGGVYNSGILATGTRGAASARFDYAPAAAAIRARVARIEAVCDLHCVTLAAAALQFAAAEPLVASVIPGIASADEVSASIKLWDERIPSAFWDDLKADGLIDAASPVPNWTKEAVASCS